MKVKLAIIFLTVTNIALAQLRELRGVVSAKGDVEGIHILNKSSVKYTVTDTDGSFEILAKFTDTLVLSGLRYEMKEVFITQRILQDNNLRITLEEKVTELDEITIGRILTGNIASDVGNMDLKEEVNFYNLGIPGYTGKPKTIPERKLADANHGKMFALGLGGAVNINKLLNKISGRTKKLKRIVDLDERDKCMQKLKAFYSESLFKDEELTKAQHADYFYFCMDDENFKELCNRNNPTEIIPFLKQKLVDYKTNLNSKDD